MVPRPTCGHATKAERSDLSLKTHTHTKQNAANPAPLSLFYATTERHVRARKAHSRVMEAGGSIKSRATRRGVASLGAKAGAPPSRPYTPHVAGPAPRPGLWQTSEHQCTPLHELRELRKRLPPLAIEQGTDWLSP